MLPFDRFTPPSRVFPGVPTKIADKHRVLGGGLGNRLVTRLQPMVIFMGTRDFAGEGCGDTISTISYAKKKHCLGFSVSFWTTSTIRQQAHATHPGGVDTAELRAVVCQQRGCCVVHNRKGVRFLVFIGLKIVHDGDGMTRAVFRYSCCAPRPQNPCNDGCQVCRRAVPRRAAPRRAMPCHVA